MEIRFNVVRFRNEDVIATSGIVDICQQFGARHIKITSENAIGDRVIYGGDIYSYSAEDGLVLINEHAVGLSSYNGNFEVGKYYYYNKGRYVLCSPQAHGR